MIIEEKNLGLERRRENKRKKETIKRLLHSIKLPDKYRFVKGEGNFTLESRGSLFGWNEEMARITLLPNNNILLFQISDDWIKEYLEIKPFLESSSIKFNVEITEDDFYY